eukprot:g2567.t1
MTDGFHLNGKLRKQRRDRNRTHRTISLNNNNENDADLNHSDVQKQEIPSFPNLKLLKKKAVDELVEPSRHKRSNLKNLKKVNQPSQQDEDEEELRVALTHFLRSHLLHRNRRPMNVKSLGAQLATTTPEIREYVKRQNGLHHFLRKSRDFYVRGYMVMIGDKYEPPRASKLLLHDPFLKEAERLNQEKCNYKSRQDMFSGDSKDNEWSYVGKKKNIQEKTSFSSSRDHSQLPLPQEQSKSHQPQKSVPQHQSQNRLNFKSVKAALPRNAETGSFDQMNQPFSQDQNENWNASEEKIDDEYSQQLSGKEIVNEIRSILSQSMAPTLIADVGHKLQYGIHKNRHGSLMHLLKRTPGIRVYKHGAGKDMVALVENFESKHDEEEREERKQNMVQASQQQQQQQQQQRRRRDTKRTIPNAW